MKEKIIKIDESTNVKLSIIMDDLNNCYVLEYITFIDNEIVQRATGNYSSFDNYIQKMVDMIDNFNEQDAINFMSGMDELCRL